MSDATSSNASPRRSTMPASIAHAMNASSGSALCPTRIDHGGHVTLVTMARAGLSESIQDYLKSVYKLQAEHGRVTIGSLAKDQSVSPASASAMVKKLAALELLEHEPYRGAQLTESGERVALEVIRHHRLLELYLAKTLGLRCRRRARRSRPAGARDLRGARGPHRPRARLPDPRPARRPDPGRQPGVAGDRLTPPARDRRHAAGGDSANARPRRAAWCQRERRLRSRACPAGAAAGRWRQLRPKKKRSRGAISSSRRNGLTFAAPPSSSETTASSSSVPFAASRQSSSS